MSRLDRHIGRAVLNAMLLAWAVVVVLDALFVLLGQLGDIGRGDYGLGDALRFVALGTPTRAWQVFPMAALIGVLLGLGNLAEQRELDALRLAGCSPSRLLLAVMRIGLLLLLGGMLLGEVVAPAAQHLAQQWRAQSIHGGAGTQTDAGFWVRDRQRFIQIGRSGPDDSVQGLVVYELGPGPRLSRIISAARAQPQDGRWRLDDVVVTRFETQRIGVERHARIWWPTLMARGLVGLLTRDSATLSLPQLARYIDYLAQNGNDVGLWRLGFWQRLAAPLNVLAMLALAAVLVLGSLGRRPLGQRLLVAVLTGVAFQLLGGVVSHAGLVYGLNVGLSAVLPALSVLVGVVLYARFGQPR